MSMRRSRVVMGMVAVAALALLPGLCWAVFYELGPSKDEWGLKYEVAVSDAGGGKMNVEFTLADEGRLKPLHNITVVAFSKPDSQGGRSYDVKAPIELKTTPDGKRIGQVQIPKEFANRATIRLLTLTVNGKRSTSASYYDVHLQKYLEQGTGSAVPLASPPTTNATK